MVLSQEKPIFLSGKIKNEAQQGKPLVERHPDGSLTLRQGPTGHWGWQVVFATS